MRTKGIGIVLVLFIYFSTLYSLCAQKKKIKLDFIYSDWIMKTSKVSDNILIFRSPRIQNFQNDGDPGARYHFVKNDDSILYEGKKTIRNKRIGWCGNEIRNETTNPSIDEVWILDKKNLQLKHQLVFEKTGKEEKSKYLANYSIRKLKRDYLELELKDESYGQF